MTWVRKSLVGIFVLWQQSVQARHQHWPLSFVHFEWISFINRNLQSLYLSGSFLFLAFLLLLSDAHFHPLSHNFVILDGLLLQKVVHDQVGWILRPSKDFYEELTNFAPSASLVVGMVCFTIKRFKMKKVQSDSSFLCNLVGFIGVP